MKKKIPQKGVSKNLFGKTAPINSHKYVKPDISVCMTAGF